MGTSFNAQLYLDTLQYQNLIIMFEIKCIFHSLNSDLYEQIFNAYYVCYHKLAFHPALHMTRVTMHGAIHACIKQCANVQVRQESVF